MKKYNFILNESTVQVFINRMDKILAKTGSCFYQGEYTGAQEIDGWLKSIGLTKLFHPNPVVKMTGIYMLHDKVSFRPEIQHSLLYIHVNSDCAIDIPFGTKMFITDNQVRFKDVNKFGTHCRKNPQGYICKIVPYTDIRKAVQQHDYEEDMSAWYWKEVEREWELDNTLIDMSEAIGYEPDL